MVAGEYDQVDVSGNVSIDGALDVSLLDPFSLEAFQTFTILDIDGNRIGQFDGLGEGDSVGNVGGMDLFITYAAGDGNDVALFTETFAADFDVDGDVDGDDFLVWQAGFNADDRGDANGDGVTDGDDFLIWQSQLGPGSGRASGAVPEPAAAWLMMIIVFATACFQLCRRVERVCA